MACQSQNAVLPAGRRYSPRPLVLGGAVGPPHTHPLLNFLTKRKRNPRHSWQPRAHLQVPLLTTLRWANQRHPQGASVPGPAPAHQPGDPHGGRAAGPRPAGARAAGVRTRSPSLTAHLRSAPSPLPRRPAGSHSVLPSPALPHPHIGAQLWLRPWVSMGKPLRAPGSPDLRTEARDPADTHKSHSVCSFGCVHVSCSSAGALPMGLPGALKCPLNEVSLGCLVHLCESRLAPSIPAHTRPGGWGQRHPPLALGTRPWLLACALGIPRASMAPVRRGNSPDLWLPCCL